MVELIKLVSFLKLLTKINRFPHCGLSGGSHSEILRIRIFVSEEYFKFGGDGVVLHPNINFGLTTPPQ